MMDIPTSNDIYIALAYMKDRFKDVVFIVASDSKEWCARFLLGENIYISNMTSFYEDFVLMTCCDHTIMTVGTFGWWASWLTAQRGGTVMYYQYPFKTGGSLDKSLGRKNHFPEDWIPYNRTVILSLAD